ncbi:hypothetical protein [Alicyclobacillus shizuokensis]|uniref:hypothetical protein n=1 Tax=Alicyclobacillus shizuokensis TaxID=392014 RepID=UPI00082DA6A9|nr:hypothetical protein [Alicyclobacillus shizuokensis]
MKGLGLRDGIRLLLMSVLILGVMLYLSWTVSLAFGLFVLVFGVVEIGTELFWIWLVQGGEEHGHPTS